MLNKKNELIEKLLEFKDITEDQHNDIKREMECIDILEDEIIIIKNAMMLTSDNESIYEVYLVNDGMERFVCYIIDSEV